MKIAQWVPKLKNGSVDNIALLLAEDFARLGHDSHVLTWSRNNRLVRPVQNGVTLHSIDVQGLSSACTSTKMARFALRSWMGDKAYLHRIAPYLSRQFNQLHQRMGFDVCLLHEHHLFPLLTLNTPSFLVAHNNRSFQMQPGSDFYRLYAPRYLGLNVISVSQGVAEDLVRNFHMPGGQVSAIYNPVDLERISKLAEDNIDSVIPPANSFVIAVGRNSKQKRFDRLLRIYQQARIPHKLVILGDADKDQNLRQMVRQLGLEQRVIFPGFRDNPYPWIKQARALVLTSDFEGLSMVLIESLALGTPVISTDCPSGPREILGHGLSEWLVPVEEEAELAARLQRVVIEPPKIPPRITERFERSHVARQYLSTLRQLTTGA